MSGPADKGTAVWDAVWTKNGALPEWDYLSEEVWQFLRQALPAISGLSILEAGCGTGRISLRLARAGASVALVDLSTVALEISRGFFARASRTPRLVRGDIMRLPFGEATFDAVWSAGVLEHFSAEERQQVLREMARVCRPGGSVITIVPNARAVIYRAAKARAERTGQWRYGYEEPLSSLRKEYEQAGLRWVWESCLALRQELSFAREFLTRHRGVIWILDQLLHRILRPLRCAGYLRGALGIRD